MEVPCNKRAACPSSSVKEDGMDKSLAKALADNPEVWALAIIVMTLLNRGHLVCLS